jgi:glycosyltransferase involved in cell wall biosynthesis
VATAVDGTAEVVEQGRTGCLVPAGNAEALAAAVCSLLAEPDRSRQMGEAARERVNRLFSFEQQLDETIRIFTHYLGGSLRRQAA